jgi:hypothetical protein
MYIFEETEEIDVKAELKNIAEKLGYSYIEKRPAMSVNDIHRGVIQIGQVNINIVYKLYVQDITVDIIKKNINCTDGVKDITDLAIELQTASMVIKSIQDSEIMG